MTGRDWEQKGHSHSSLVGITGDCVVRLVNNMSEIRQRNETYITCIVF